MNLKYVFKLLPFILIFSCTDIFSQEISGTVFDSNKNPLQGVSIYLDGTTNGATTDVDGQFLIKSQQINTTLVISYIGFETIYVNDPFQNNNQKFYLTIKNESLQEIVIRKESFSRKQKLNVFRIFFLGKTEAGQSCKILNEDALNLEYDYKNNILTATSSEPIQIKNKYLGYQVDFNIHTFDIQFKSKSIIEKDAYRSIFFGTTLYKSTAENNAVYKHRQKVYYGSKLQLFKNMTQNIWNKKSFLLFKGSYITNPSEHFTVSKDKELYKVEVLNNDLAKMQFIKDKFKSSFSVLFNNDLQSKIIFSTSTFYVDSFGNNSDGDKIEFSGYLSEGKVGDMLPINYEP